jgi:hypothetical protein
MMTLRHVRAALLSAFVAAGGAQAAPAPASTADAQPPARTQSTEPQGDQSAAAAPTRKPFESLMFTIDEYNEIQGRMASGSVTDSNSGKQAIENATLYLSTIVYYGPKDWTIWVNDVPIGPNQDFQSFQVTDINADSVQLLVPLSAQGMRPVRLSPNQTFITKTGVVVEGRVQ